MKTGDLLELFDGTGKVYTAKILNIEKGKINCKVFSSKESENELKVKVTLVQALPKGGKMDFIIEKCTELGARSIIPMLTERTIGKSNKIERWKKISKEAAEQSGRAYIPDIQPLTKFEEVLKLRKQFSLALIPWELETEKTLKQVLTDPRIPGSPDILFLVGPEGGFSQNEIEQAKEAGFISVSLGKRILRTETAAMAVLSAIMYELG